MDVARFVSLVRRNPVVDGLLDRMCKLDLPDFWIVSGCLTHTVWNVEDGHPPMRGIKDYDLFYFDSNDLSWEAEDRAIKEAGALFADLPGEIELRNQARVHLWFDERNGTTGYTPLSSSREGIERFLQWATAIGIRQQSDGKIEICAPYGLDHLERRLIRRNPRALGPGATYEEKARRWKELWPNLTVIPWDA